MGKPLAGKRLQINPLDARTKPTLIANMLSRLFYFTILALIGSSAAQAIDPVPPYTPNPAIWKLADDDTEIYMLGTIHALSPEIKWRSGALDSIIGQVDELVVETTDNGRDPLNKAMMAQMIGALNRKPLLDRVDPKNRETLKNLAGELDISMDYLDLVPTWMVAFVLFYNDAGEEGVSQDHGVETVLEGLFKKAKKPIRAIEDGDAVDAALNGLSEKDQIIALNEMLAEIRTAPDASLLPDQPSTEHPYAEDISWAKGDIAGISKEMTPGKMGAAYYRALLVDRNAAWTRWLDERMARPGKLLLAVGAAHLAGPDSVQVMLGKKGRKVERVH